MKKLLPLHAMAENFGLARKSVRSKLGRKLTEILDIFFGLHTANVVQQADRIEQRAHLAASRNENMHIEKCFHRGTMPLS